MITQRTQQCLTVTGLIAGTAGVGAFGAKSYHDARDMRRGALGIDGDLPVALGACATSATALGAAAITAYRHHGTSAHRLVQASAAMLAIGAVGTISADLGFQRSDQPYCDLGLCSPAVSERYIPGAPDFYLWRPNPLEHPEHYGGITEPLP